MLKYGGITLQNEIKNLFKHIINSKKIPKKWKKSNTIPMFKKGKKTSPDNYRGITLLNSILKTFTKLILEELCKSIQIREEQQGFRKNRSTIDAIFIVRQIAEKSREYNKPAYLCFVDMTKAFDRVRLTDAIKIMREKGVNPPLLQLITDINQHCTTNIRIGHLVTEAIKINRGIRHSLSTWLWIK